MVSTVLETSRRRTWITNKLWEEWLPQPAEIYYKGNFKGFFFCRFDTIADRDKVVDNIRRLHMKIQNETVWSNADLPPDVRIPEHFLFGLKKLLVSWGYTREQLWVDKEK